MIASGKEQAAGSVLQKKQSLVTQTTLKDP